MLTVVLPCWCRIDNPYPMARLPQPYEYLLFSVVLITITSMFLSLQELDTKRDAKLGLQQRKIPIFR